MSKSPSLRRIQADVRELALDPSDRYHAAPLEHDMFEWHFTIRGAEGTVFEGGIYHGRILLPPEYPFKPPHIVFLTPSGRFETNTKVCLSFSAFHPELWQPAWGIRLILEALISFLPTPADGAIGALDWTKEERQRLANLSQNYCCPTCGKIKDLLPELKGDRKPASKSRFEKEIAELQRLQQAAEKNDPEAKKGEEKQQNGDGKIEARSEHGPASEAVGDSMNQEAPEEEIIFDDSADVSGNDILRLPENESEPKEKPNPITEQETNTPEVVEREPLAPMDDPSWMYDPLLNLMMVLMAVVCYLLMQKYRELMEELGELQQLSDLK